MLAATTWTALVSTLLIEDNLALLGPGAAWAGCRLMWHAGPPVGLYFESRRAKEDAGVEGGGGLRVALSLGISPTSVGGRRGGEERKWRSGGPRTEAQTAE